jgi:hypothetical protein
VKALIIIAGQLLLAATAGASADTSVSDLQRRVDAMQKAAHFAQVDFDSAKDAACARMSMPDMTRWQQAEAKFDKLAASGGDPHKISGQEDAIESLESHMMKPADHADLDAKRRTLASRLSLLHQAQEQLADARRKDSQDESSQFTQPENRTQNGSNFSVRSERDAENHPPLPPSQ